MNERFGRAVDVATRIRKFTRDGTQVDDMSATAFHHAGKHRAGAIHESLDVGVDHRFPIVHSRLVRRLQAKGKPGIIHEYVDLGKRSGQRCDGSLDGIPVAYVENERMNVLAELLAERIQPLAAATRRDNPPSLRSVPACYRRPKPRRCTRDKRDHSSILFRLSRSTTPHLRLKVMKACAPVWQAQGSPGQAVPLPAYCT